MIRRILVPLDSSSFAETALFFAATLAQRGGAELRLVQVCDPERIALSGTADKDCQHARTYVERIRRSRGTADGEVTAVVRIGTPGQEIVREAQESGADLIVMATHGRSGVERLFLGSVAAYCSRHSPVPILLVRSYGNSGAFAVGRVVIPVDGTELSEAAVPAGLEIARLFGVPIALVRGVVRNEGPEPGLLPQVLASNQQRLEERHEIARAYLERLVCELRQSGVSVSGEVILADHPSRAILTYAGGDLVAMSTHGRGPLHRALIGSVADGVLRRSPGPVLVVPPPSARRPSEGPTIPELSVFP